MKHIYSLFLLMLCSVLGYGQQPIITTIVDGTCTGGTPKLIEIYANGTVDFTQYTLQKSANGGAFGSDFDLSVFGTRTDDFVYVYSGDETILNAEFPSIATADYQSSGAANNNGDDAIRIIETTSTTVIDMYGMEVDGSGTSWEYLDSYAKRVDGTGPDATFNQSNWITSTPNTLDNQCGTTTFESIIGVGSYSTTVNTNPTLSITAPANNASLSSGDFVVSFTITNFMVAMTGGDGYVQYQLDGGAFSDKFDTTDISFTGVAAGAHTITLQLVDNGGAVLSPAVNSSINITVASQQQAQDIAALRAVSLPSTDVYVLASEAIITHTETFRNQKWIEDTSAGVLIDDPNGVITTSLTTGDGVTNITGTLSEFNGLLQFTPTQDTGAPSSTGNTVNPQIVTLAMLTSNAEDYESELVQVAGITFDNADGTLTFTNGDEQSVSNGADSFIHRALFDTDYTGSIIPTNAVDLTGFITQRSNGYFISARNLSDITLGNSSVNLNSFKIFPNPVEGGILNIEIPNEHPVDVTIYSALGQEILMRSNVNTSLDVTSLTSGLYLVKITQGGATQTRKLIVR